MSQTGIRVVYIELWLRNATRPSIDGGPEDRESSEGGVRIWDAWYGCSNLISFLSLVPLAVYGRVGYGLWVDRCVRIGGLQYY